ncbi:O-antigen ligase [Thermoleptolyngbya sp. M55_K2018_002]|uniref:O-antigen ligase family protein n=1 Tax=Thermoleptolyngbya sp. M55_K2018_002 TaxID=2747808 RepID=UPI0019DA6657|nr:O-antigen ligase [Thermoleptolyngbya sp. M55_K2018_002]MCA1994655.1 O-antigen ligase family protein [Coleofasciculus sp. S288]HIK42194.1 O-antigen ligase family protein [Thermoleptolyngbya sp. M55_K2018_002]
MKKLWRFLELAFVIAYLILYAGGILTLFLSGGFSEGNAGSLRDVDFALIRQLLLVNYGISFLLLLWRWKYVVQRLFRSPFLLILLGLVVCSVLWSAQPSLTQTRAIALLGTTLFGIYFGTRFSPKEQLNILAITFSIILLLSLVFVIALPQYGKMSGIHAGAWRGIFIHKNPFGQLMVLSSLIFLSLSLRGGQSSWKAMLGLTISVFMIVMSASSSSLINFVTLFLVFTVLKVTLWPDRVMIPVISALAAFGCFASIFLVEMLELVVGSVGKDLTLTGRTDIWPIVIRQGLQRPILGYGYSGFWGDWNSPGAAVWKDYGWLAPNAHNGFIDLWIQLGFVGAAVFILGFLQMFIRSLQLSKQSDPSLYSWSVIYLIFTCLINSTESSLMVNNSLNWVLFVSLGISLQLQKSRLRQPKDSIKISADNLVHSVE